MGKFIKLTTSDGVTINAYRADPAGQAKGGVVVVQEVFGVNHHIRAMCDRFAAQGYLAVAPATFDRAQMGFETDDYSPEGRGPVMELMKQVKPDLAVLDIEAAVKVAAEGGKVGITGYCFGGMLCWRAGAKGLGDAISGYYGGGIPNYIDLAPKTPIIMHYGDQDQGIPMEQVEQLRAKYPDVPMYIYHAGHGFNCDERGSYDAPSAAKAMERTLEFFGKHL